MNSGGELRLSKDPNFFPMMVRLAGRKCLVVGAGKIAADKIDGLLVHGARVEVVSPRAVRRIQEQAREGKIVWRRSNFSPRYVNDAFCVVAATDSSATNQAVFRACKARGILCNAVDDPEHCDFFYPAVVRRGPLQIAISTNGQSPALAARLRRELEKQFGPEWGGWVEHVGRMRRKAFRDKMPAKARRQRLLEMASLEAFQEFINPAPLDKGGTASASVRRRTSK
ncbi:MAG TPA: bifunctional precorrin-2 dehydrogenase/sirohydrochlorin ferrochelatase [Terriglobales bacterium]